MSTISSSIVCWDLLSPISHPRLFELSFSRAKHAFPRPKHRAMGAHLPSPLATAKAKMDLPMLTNLPLFKSFCSSQELKKGKNSWSTSNTSGIRTKAAAVPLTPPAMMADGSHTWLLARSLAYKHDDYNIENVNQKIKLSYLISLVSSGGLDHGPADDRPPFSRVCFGK